MSVGGSTGALLAEGVTAGSVNVEVTGAWALVSLSTGLRTAHQQDVSHFMPYVEAGFWFVVSVGVGYAAGFSVGGDDAPRIPRHNVNLFVGVPIPVKVWKNSKKHHRVLYLEPYYRPQWGTGGGARGWSHEVGLQLKWLIGWGFLKLF
jgi:hypothetical protein